MERFTLMDLELPDRPLVQIDDVVRPMTDEEYVDYVTNVTSRPGNPEAPASDDAGVPSTDAG